MAVICCIFEGGGMSKIEKRLLNIHEAAEYLGLTVGTMYVWVSQRKIPYVKVGRLTKFDKNDLDSWIDDHKIAVGKFAT